MQILFTNTKGGCGKSLFAACFNDVLGNCDIVDHDPQGTLRVTSQFTGRHKPILFGEASKRFVLHDTPPYNTTNLNSLIKEVDLVVIPTKLMYADLVAIATIINSVEKLKATHKTHVVFNEVRHHNKTLNDSVRKMYIENYPSVSFAKTEIPNWIGYSHVLAKELGGKERDRMIDLVKELNIYKNSI